MPTLKELCIHLLQENVDKIDGPTGLPYDVMEPILLRASPTTLMNIEEYNQYLMEDTGIAKYTLPRKIDCIKLLK